MRANLEVDHGAVMAEAAMMAVARELGHERAHAAVAAASRRARVENRGLLEVLAEQPSTAPLFDERARRVLSDPETYLGWSVELANDCAQGGGIAAAQGDRRATGAAAGGTEPA
jgi:adenylosuccinate lyase